MVDGTDNFVLTLRDVEERRDYYSRVLGMEVEEFEGGQRALKSGRQKINNHQSGAEFEPKAGRAHVEFGRLLPHYQRSPGESRGARPVMRRRNYRRTRLAYRSDQQARIDLLPRPGRQPRRGRRLRGQHRRVTALYSPRPFIARWKASQASVAHRMRLGVWMMPLSATRSPSSSFSSVPIISRNASISASTSS